VITLIADNLLSQSECNMLIDYYKKNENFSKKFRDVYPLDLKIKDPNINFLETKLNFISKNFNSEIDWFQIVKWPINSTQNLHFDTASQKTTLTSITYLNDDYTGGQTYYENGTIFKPKKGRGLFFNGQYHKHGVKPVSKNIRYVVAAWYKKIQLNPSF
jgi:hypothetical protein